MSSLMLWLYFMDAILLIVHEIDSAYWKEWDVFGLKGGITGFLLLHIPLLFIVLYGLLRVFQQTRDSVGYSVLVSAAGIAAFFIHMYFLKKGRPEFNTPVSIGLLIAIFLTSIALLGVGLHHWMGA